MLAICANPIPVRTKPYWRCGLRHSIHRFFRYAETVMAKWVASSSCTASCPSGIIGTEKEQLLPPGVAGPGEARPACTSPLQGSGCQNGTRTHGPRINSPLLYRLSYLAISKSDGVRLLSKISCCPGAGNSLFSQSVPSRIPGTDTGKTPSRWYRCFLPALRE